MRIRADARGRVALTLIGGAFAAGLILQQRVWLVFAAGLLVQFVALLLVTRVQRGWPRSTAALARLSRDLLRSLPRSHRDHETWPLVQHLSAALGQTQVTIVLLDEHENVFREHASTRLRDEPLVISRDALSCWANALKEGRWFRRASAIEPPALKQILDTADVSSVLPVNVEGRTVAFLLLGPLQVWLSAPGRELLNDVGRETGALLQSVMLRELAAIDPLTQLPRRHIAQERLAHEAERSLRSGAPFALIMVDIDHFKRVNDEFGHAAGDAVLRRIARVLVAESRRIDLVSRWGGEEFMIVLPETNLAGVTAVAEKLRTAVEATEFETPAGAIRLTISLGVAQIDPLADPDLESAIELVDRALYRAKIGGRNRVEWDPQFTGALVRAGGMQYEGQDVETTAIRHGTRW